MNIIPYLYYEDVAGALEWLGRAFGLREQLRVPGADGRVMHAEMALGDGRIMMGHPGPEYRNPLRLGHVTQSLYVTVDDVDAHSQRARQAGARIIQEPANQSWGARTYGAADVEGHHWYFGQEAVT